MYPNLEFQWISRSISHLPKNRQMTTMTIMTIDTKNRAYEPWTVASAKAKLSQLIDLAGSQGPQSITRNGRVAAIVVSPDEWQRKTHRVGNLAEFFANSPLVDSGIVLERQKDGAHEIEL